MYTDQIVGAELAREGDRIAGLVLADVPKSNVGAELARDGGLTADQSFAGVHIHSCGNGHLGFRPYGQPFQGVFPLWALSTRAVDT